MATVMSRQDVGAAQQRNEALRKPPQGLNCGMNRSRGAKPKYTWRPEYDAYLKTYYFGDLNRRFRVLNRMIRLTGLPRWYVKRQAARLGLTMHMDRSPGLAQTLMFWTTWRAACRLQRLQSGWTAR